MARQLRVEYSGAIYHVTCRMVGDWQGDKTSLFKDDADRERFLERLGERVEQFHIRLYLFVLMTNHFHLVFETPEGNCSKFMHTLATAYTVYYNLRHGRHGHLLDGRFKAKLVEGDDYLLSLSRYVHLNPVQVGVWKEKPIEERIACLREYRWSSYPGYIGKGKAQDFVVQGPVLARMQGRKSDWREKYRKFVETGLAKTDEDIKQAMKQSPRCIGGEGFRVWVDDLYRERLQARARPEDVSFRHITEPLGVDEVLSLMAGVFGVGMGEFKRRRQDSPLRAVAAMFLLRYAGLSQREVADVLTVGSGAAICNQLSRFPKKLARDRRLRQLVKEVEAKINVAWKKRFDRKARCNSNR
jgi:REP element-mobilizing transposase RayT